MRLPCDEAIIGTGDAEVPCEAKARPWILAATILGSSMAFIDGTVVNVALPTIQANFRATVVDVQWVVESYGLFLCIDSSGRFARCPVWPPSNVPGGCGDLRGRLRGLRRGLENSSAHHREEHSRRGGRTPGAREPCDYKHIFRREEPWAGDRHVVGLFGDHHRDWSGSSCWSGRVSSGSMVRTTRITPGLPATRKLRQQHFGEEVWK